jgi:hypothetical protein
VYHEKLFSYLLLEHLTENLDGIEIEKARQGHVYLTSIKVEEFAQYKYARMWLLRRTSGKSYLCRTCDVKFSENDSSPEEMCINCSDKDKENRDAEHEAEREQQHEGASTLRDEEARGEEEKEDREEGEIEEEYSMRFLKKKRKSAKKKRKRIENKT